jgi:thiamine-phosphate pyrophosphorylase
MLDPFYLIVDSNHWLRRLLPQGVKLVQLRAKNLTDAQAYAEIADAKALCTRYGAQLVVNDYWQAALDRGCDYVHLGQEDLETADVAALKKAGIKLGLSTHNEAELVRALEFSPDYIALGPIYPTILKKMPWAPQGLEKITLWKQKIGTIPLIAIGGFTLERASGAFTAGADSVAVVTDVTLNADPEQRVRDWLAITH